MVVSPVCWQILATLAAASSTFGWGCSIGLSATLISKLRHDEFGLSITDEDASWIGSCLAIGGAVGSLVTGNGDLDMHQNLFLENSFIIKCFY